MVSPYFFLRLDIRDRRSSTWLIRSGEKSMVRLIVAQIDGSVFEGILGLLDGVKDAGDFRVIF